MIAKTISKAPLLLITLAIFCTPISSLLVNIFIILGLTTVVLLSLYYRQSPLDLQCPVSRIVFLLIMLFIIGISYSTATSAEIFDTLKKLSRFLLIPLTIQLFYDSKWRRIALIAFFASIALSFVVLICYHYGLLSLHSFGFKYHNIFKDHIFSSLFIACSIFFLVHLIVQYKHHKIFLYGLALLTALLTYYLLFINTGKSGQAVFFILAILFVVQLYPAMKTKNIIIIILTLLFLLFAALYTSSSFKQRFNAAYQQTINYIHTSAPQTTKTSMGLRLEFDKQSWKIFTKKPLFGWGTGNFFQTYQHLTGKQVPNPHNQYLLYMVQIGIFGLIVLLALFFSIFKASLALPKIERYYCQGLTVAFAAGCLANSWLNDFTSAHFFMLGIGVCFGAYPKANTDSSLPKT